MNADMHRERMRCIVNSSKAGSYKRTHILFLQNVCLVSAYLQFAGVLGDRTEHSRLHSGAEVLPCGRAQLGFQTHNGA